MSGGNNGKVLTVSRKLAKILTVSRKSHHPIETLLFILSYFLFHTLEGTVRKMAFDMFWQS